MNQCVQRKISFLPFRAKRAVLLFSLLWLSSFSSFAQNTPTAEALAVANSRTVVPILSYHRFGNYPEPDDYSVSVEEFKRHLEIIQTEGFTPITATTLLAGWEGTQALPAKPILITVDDGYKDFKRHALPLLKAFGFPATLFIYTNFVGSRLGLSAADLQALQAAGFEIGSHSATHPKLISHLSQETLEQRKQRLQQELAQSRSQLQTWSGGQVNALAYPYGLWDEEVAEVARQAGYGLMFTVSPGTNNAHTPRIALKRYMILRHLREKNFKTWLYTRPFELAAWDPSQGQRVKGPLLQPVTLTLASDQRPDILPDSLRARCGEKFYPVKYDALAGRLQVHLPPIRRGVYLLDIWAFDHDQHRYQESGLLIIDP